MTDVPIPRKLQRPPPSDTEAILDAFSRLITAAGEVPSGAAATPCVFDEYQTRRQFADELGISERTADRWHALRIGPPRVKIGRLILYPKAGKREWLASHASAPVRSAEKRMGRR
jgi:hypothetical protein